MNVRSWGAGRQAGLNVCKWVFWPQKSVSLTPVCGRKPAAQHLPDNRASSNP